MIKKAYIDGFKNRCDALGVDAKALAKYAGWFGAWPRLERASERFLNPPVADSLTDPRQLTYLAPLMPIGGAIMEATEPALASVAGSAAPAAAAGLGAYGGVAGVYGFNATEAGKKFNKNTQAGWEEIMKKHPWIAGIRRGSLVSPGKKALVDTNTGKIKNPKR